MTVCHSFNMLDKNDIFRNVRWAEFIVFSLNCSKIFFSYVPNTFANQPKIFHWTLNKNYDATNEDVYPRRSESAKDILYFSLNSLKEVGCIGSDTFTIKLHHPVDFATRPHDINLNINKTYNILITPNIIVSSDILRTYSPQRKKCFFPEDRYLHFYKIYSVQNCKSECLANHTLKICGCVPYYLPRNCFLITIF